MFISKAKILNFSTRLLQISNSVEKFCDAIRSYINLISYLHLFCVNKPSLLQQETNTELLSFNLFILKLEKKSPNLGDCQDGKNWIEYFEGKMIIWMLGTRIFITRWDVRINAKQNDNCSSSDFQNLTFQFPDHEEFWSSFLQEIFFVLIWWSAIANVKENRNKFHCVQKS